MNRIINKIRKKLIHFYTDGNINADFAASKRKKSAILRRIIQVCFYLHCAAAIVCIILALAGNAGVLTVPVAIGTIVAATVSFFAAGGTALHRTVLYVIDLVCGAGSFVIGSVCNTPIFFGIGVVMLIAGFSALASFLAGAARDYLESYSPKLIRREDYTLIRNPEKESEENAETETPPIPPLTDEMQELAKQVRDVLHGNGS